jgi:hypothetical protein
MAKAMALAKTLGRTWNFRCMLNPPVARSTKAMLAYERLVIVGLNARTDAGIASRTE